ncbi:MAG: hypothetical protein NPIRA06_11470 [Nitrospirales bacterium]|nr:MAG: hypothetical protein NPIRA06_11470 [Nitrospirales bacterium]
MSSTINSKTRDRGVGGTMIGISRTPIYTKGHVTNKLPYGRVGLNNQNKNVSVGKAKTNTAISNL